MTMGTVMMNDPPELRYTPNDLHMYEDFVYRTNVTSHPRQCRSWKKSLQEDQRVDAYISTFQDLTLCCGR